MWKFWFCAGLLYLSDLRLVTCDVDPEIHHMTNGDVILQLFQWPWKDVEKECEVLGEQKGIGAVQVSSPQEHRVIFQSPINRLIKRPWWERYQPVSFSLGNTRGGTLDEFRRMVNTCNTRGIKVYAEVIVSHLMGIDSGVGRGTHGTWYAVGDKNVTLSANGETDSLTPDEISAGLAACTVKVPLPFSYSEDKPEPDHTQLYDCQPHLPYTFGAESPLIKLNLQNDVIVGKIRNILTELLDMGVSGFCVISATFSSPAEISNLVKDLLLKKSSKKPFVYVDILDQHNYGLVYEFSSEVQIATYSLEAAQNISNAVSFGTFLPKYSNGSEGNGDTDYEDTVLEEDSEDNLKSLFYKLENLRFVYSKEGTTLRNVVPIISFEHHEQLHSINSGTSNVDYSSIKRLADQNLRRTASVAILLQPPQNGIPRIVADFQPSNENTGWIGPPATDNFTILSPLHVTDNYDSESSSAWKLDHRDPGLKKLLKFRSDIFDSTNQTQVLNRVYETDIEITRLEITDAAPTVGSLLFIVGRVEDLTIRVDVSDNCSVIVALIASHLSGSAPSLEGVALEPGNYTISRGVELTFVEDGQSNCRSDVISNVDFSLAEICITTSGKTITLPDDLPPNVRYLIFVAKATGTNACGTSEPADY